MRTVWTAIILGLLLPGVSRASENWADYRGPGGQGHSDDSDLPLTWSETENIRWKTEIPGKGWSSPVVWGKQLWMTTANDEGTQRWAVGVHRDTGQIVHRVKVFEVTTVVSQHDLNSHASPSPVIEEGRVYVHFGTYGTACLDTDTGQVIWERRDLNLDHQVGPGSSPILFEDLLIVHCDGIDVQYVIALNKKTGKTVWKTPRTADFSGLVNSMHKASCTPLLVNVDGKPQLLSIGAQAIMGYEPRTGLELWKVRFKGYSNVARPVTDGKTAIISTGYDLPQLLAFKLQGKGDVTESSALWTYRGRVPAKPSPLLVDGLVYLMHDTGIATCLDATTGEEIWKERIGGEYSASPIYADGRIYFFSQEGVTTVIAPGRTLKILAENKLDEGFMASPAVAGRALFLRTKTHLYRIER